MTMDSRDQSPETVRIKLPKLAARFVFGPAYAAFARAHPDVRVELIIDDAIADLESGGLDAGIRNGEFMQPGIVPVPVTRQMPSIIVGSPAYFEGRERPTEPRQLRDHACIAFRWAETGAPYPWPLTKGKQTLEHRPVGPLIVNDFDMMLDAALDGAGLIWTLREHANAHIDAGRLVPVLEDWCQTLPPFYLYYSKNRGLSVGLRKLIEFLSKRVDGSNR